MLNGSTDIMVDPLVTSDFIEGVMSKSRGDIMIDQAAESAVPTVCNSCSGEPTPANQVIPERPDSVIFKIHGMDCADEVTFLKREVGDRKSAGWGKSGSVRVQLGGGLFLKKKKN